MQNKIINVKEKPEVQTAIKNLYLAFAEYWYAKRDENKFAYYLEMYKKTMEVKK